MKLSTPLAGAAIALALAPWASAQVFDADRLAESHHNVYQSMLQADLDGDGRVDVLTARWVLDTNEFGPRMRVFWGLPGGEFERGTAAPSLPNTTVVSSMAWTDLDGDGRREVLVGIRDALVFAFFTLEVDPADRSWSGPTAFVPPGIDAASGSLEQFDVLDVDGDGDEDLLLLVNPPGPGPRTVIRWSERLSPSLLAAPVDLVDSPQLITSFRSGDQDGDGDLDLLVSGGPTGGYGWFLNDGDPGSPFIPVGGPPQFAQQVLHDAGDVDGDGDADAVYNFLEGGVVNIGVRLSTGPGTVGREAVVATDRQARALRLAAIGAPGTLDIVISEVDPVLLVIPGDGAGGFGPVTPLGSPLEGFFDEWQFGDVDGDGDTDLLVALRLSVPGDSSNLVRSLRNVSAGGVPTLEAAADVVPWASDDDRAVVADVTGDGFPDVVVPHRESRASRIYRGDAAGALTEWELVTTGLTRSQQLRAGDVDGDGVMDLVALDQDSGTLTWVGYRRADGAWVPRAVGSVFARVIDLVVLDDGDDGDLDVMVLTRRPGSREELVLFENVGAGQFLGPRVVFEEVAGVEARWMDVADLDGDGRQEVLVGRPAVTTGLRAFARTAQGDYAPTGALDGAGPGGGPSICTSGSIGDLDGDGDLDVVTAGNFPGAPFAWYENVDGVTFVERALAAGWPALSGSAVRSVVVLDADGDGDLDIAASGENIGASLVLFENAGAGAFGPGYPATDRGTIDVQLVAADLDGDGRDECLGPWREFRGVTVFRGRPIDGVGAAYCGPAVANSTGRSGAIGLSGSASVGVGRAVLNAWALPPNQFGLFAASRTPGLVTSVPNSVGTLCLGGTIGRFVAPGQIQRSGLSGSFRLELDLLALPEGGQLAVALAGDTWHFQAWHRDRVGGVQTSNFTEALAVTWR